MKNLEKFNAYVSKYGTLILVSKWANPSQGKAIERLHRENCAESFGI